MKPFFNLLEIWIKVQVSPYHSIITMPCLVPQPSSIVHHCFSVIWNLILQPKPTEEPSLACLDWGKKYMFSPPHPTTMLYPQDSRLWSWFSVKTNPNSRHINHLWQPKNQELHSCWKLLLVHFQILSKKLKETKPCFDWYHISLPFFCQNQTRMRASKPAKTISTHSLKNWPCLPFQFSVKRPSLPLPRATSNSRSFPHFFCQMKLITRDHKTHLHTELHIH